MAGTTGLEPATSCVTGMRSNQLNYVPVENSNHKNATAISEKCQVAWEFRWRYKAWWAVPGSNGRPSACDLVPPIKSIT